MRSKGDEELSKRVISYYLNFSEGSKVKTAEHFKSEGKLPSTIYKILRRYEATKIVGHKKSCGRTPTVATPAKKRKILQLYKGNPSITVKEVAKKVNIKPSTVKHIKRQKLGIKSNVKQKVPKYKGDQEGRAKQGCRKVYKKQLSKILIIDDETYLHWDPKDVPGRKFFSAVDPKEVPYSEKVKPQAKFPKKILIWQAIDENGNVSEPFISEGTINSEVYLKECIQARLLPFIDKHYSRDEVLFWPDMAPAHYAAKVTKCLSDNGVEFIQKSQNAPNVPQARGIEKFWAVCKSQYSKRPHPPKSLRGMKSVWWTISRGVAEKSGKRIMDNALKSLRKIAYKGVSGSE